MLTVQNKVIQAIYWNSDDVTTVHHGVARLKNNIQVIKKKRGDGKQKKKKGGGGNAACDESMMQAIRG